jgi:DNA-binding LytR/AlgR family response regulator
MKLICLIVDDEPIARQIIETYCSHFPQIEIVASCSDALQARAIVELGEVDVIFLDINMPVLDGVAFVKTLRHQCQIIFTTAYKEFAHEAFDLGVCDYLLKPFSLERFIQAVDKAKERSAKATDTFRTSAPASFIYIKTDGKIIKLSFDELLYAEASGNNIKIVMHDHQFTPAMSFSSLEDLLPKNRFIRVHRSFIVNREKIRVIEGNRIMIGATEIPIGATWREALLKDIGMK